MTTTAGFCTSRGCTRESGCVISLTRSRSQRKLITWNASVLSILSIRSESQHSSSGESHKAEWCHHLPALSIANDSPKARGQPPTFLENDTNPSDIRGVREGVPLILEILEQLGVGDRMSSQGEVISDAESENPKCSNIVTWLSAVETTIENPDVESIIPHKSPGRTIAESAEIELFAKSFWNLVRAVREWIDGSTQFDPFLNKIY
ncbi:hypothetical protein K469DRAFT_690980 [Zopfia rhizophila CBS 207.26]|uniref:Uncharacterized protein n=1 Tax=Zopfia rhizophila CBS 207.26 TaxID=1314779 RepID=A0A6A6EQS5_9PEZI|nr:hypothetical protein K469DRAFT_690980 [Zopfia rhizophila CBS 207.26]